MSLESIDAIAESEQLDYVGVWNDVQKNAELKLMTLFTSKMAERYKLRNPTQSIDLGKDLTTTTTASASEYRGVIFDLNAYNLMPSIYHYSALQSHYVQSIGIYSDAIVNDVDIQFQDAATGEELKSLTADLVVGWNTVAVNTSFTCDALAIGYDSSSINSKGLEVPSPYQWNTNCTASIKGVKWDISEDSTTADKGNDTFGMTAVYGVRCKFDNAICNNKDIFYLPYAYLCAIELTVMRQFSPRINRWTLQKDEAENLRLHYEKEFETLFETTCNSIELSDADCCIECNAPVRVIEAIP